MKQARAHRVFFAVWPDDEASSHLAALGADLAGRGGRVLRPGALHLTLAFVGAVSSAQVQQLQQIAAGVQAEAFELSLDRLGFWPQRGILWAGCREAPPPLRSLAETLVTDLGAAGFVIDHGLRSSFVPHITLARRVRCASVPRLGTPISWRVAEFALVESEPNALGASYQTLASFALDEADAD